MTEKRTKRFIIECSAHDAKVFMDGYETEPAPPKDWNPLCFDEHSLADSEFCDGVHDVNWLGYVQKELCEACQKCPRRKSGAKE